MIFTSVGQGCSIVDVINKNYLLFSFEEGIFWFFVLLIYICMFCSHYQYGNSDDICIAFLFTCNRINESENQRII